MQILTTSRTFETRSAPATATWGSTAPPLPGVGAMSAGQSVTTETALQSAAVYGSVCLISDSIATLPVRQWKMVNGEPNAMESAPVIAQPWPEITQRDFITQGTVSQLTGGNIFGKVTARDERLYPSQVQLWSPTRVAVRRDPKTGQPEWHYGNTAVPTDDVTRSMGMSLPGAIVGMNPITCMRQTMGVALAQDAYNSAYYANSAEPRGVIQVEGDLDPNETLALAKSWLQAHQGVGNAHLPAVLTGGATWEAVSMSHADQQFLEMMQFSQATISGFIYRIPPHMLGMTEKATSYGKGIEEQELAFVRNTLLIWLARWEDLMSSWLPPGQFVTFDLSERLKGDALAAWQGAQIARVIGAKSSAEIRSDFKLPKVTDPTQAALLDSFDQPLNSSPVKQLQGDGGDNSGKPTEK